MKEFLIILFILIFGGLIVKVVFFPVNTANKLVDTAYGIQDKTLNADNAIYNYEWFKQQSEDIKALSDKIFNAEAQASGFRDVAGPRDIWTFEDKTEDFRLQSITTGLKNQRVQAAADYNARSKMANRNIFANGLLPNYIDALTFEFKQ